MQGKGIGWNFTLDSPSQSFRLFELAVSHFYKGLSSTDLRIEVLNSFAVKR